jgi:glycerol-3-phosphate cytidylyltransferase
MVGYTTGIFDLIHIGHLNLLERAKENCEQLIVGVTTDELAFALKGRRPVIPFNERLRLVSALKCVDLAVAECEDDKFIYFKDFQFDIIFKGDDWRGSEKWGRIQKQANDLGVVIEFLPYTRTQSSSQIIEKIRLS